MKIRRLSIIGLGLIGGSVGLGINRFIKSCQITGYDPNPAARRGALRRGAVHRVYDELGACVRQADLVVLAMPVGAGPAILRDLAATLPVGAIVTDTCSTKRSIVAAAGRLLPDHGRRFVGGHPMFGSQHSGIRFADASMLAGARCILTPTRKTDSSAVATVRAFWRRLGLRPIVMPADRHDRLLARASHLPQVLASVLMGMQDGGTTGVSGRGLADMTRLAGSDPALWEGILTDNADNVAAAVGVAAERLKAVAEALKTGDRAGVRRMLARGKARSG